MMLYVLDDDAAAGVAVVMLNERMQHAMACELGCGEGGSGSLHDLTRNRSWWLVVKRILPWTVK
jgi:hypothetical protein